MRTRNQVAAALALMAVIVTGCSNDSTSDAKPDSAVDIIGDSPATPAGDDGDVTDESDEMFGVVDIPDYVPLPEEHEVVLAIGNPEAGYTITVTTPMSSSEVADFYENELPAAGWESMDRKDRQGTDVISIDAARAEDGHGILVQITAEGDGASVVILTGPPGG